MISHLMHFIGLMKQTMSIYTIHIQAPFGPQDIDGLSLQIFYQVRLILLDHF